MAENDRRCEICGGEMWEIDLNGNEGPYCPNECKLWKAIEEHKSEPYDHLESCEDSDQKAITHCWACPNPKIVRSEDNQDGPYGNFCPECGNSLRKHPVLGEGGIRDKGKF